MANLKEQVTKFVQFLSDSQFPVDGPVFRKAMEFVYLIKSHTSGFTPREVEDFRRAIQRCFQLSDNDLELALAGDIDTYKLPEGFSDTVDQARQIETDLWTLIPSEGYLRDYCEFTRMHEGPLAYHIFCALAGISAVVNNKVFYDMTYYPVYPALSIIFLGHSGIKKSTSAAVIVDMLQEWNYCETYSEKITPEAFQEAMANNPTGLVFASELSAMLGKQRYLEGFIPLLTRLLDHRTFPLETKSGGKITIFKPAPTFIGCSTLDWFVKNTPEDTFGGGFIARQLLVYQVDSSRVDSSPGRDANGKKIIYPQRDARRSRIQQTLGNLLPVRGEMSFTREAFHLYDSWYRTHKTIARSTELGLLQTYYQRKHDHAKRIAMNLHLAHHSNMLVCSECWNLAISLLSHIEHWITPAFKEMFKSGSGIDADLVLNILKTHNGVIDHSKLVRTVQYRMDATRLRVVLNSLKEGRLIEEKGGHGKLQHCYLLIGDV